MTTPETESSLNLAIRHFALAEANLDKIERHLQRLMQLVPEGIDFRHWLDRSITLPDVSSVKDQMSLWQSPRVDVLIIATTGRFTTNAVDFIEKHNSSDRAMKIEMWPESHLERLLAERPGLVAEFRLR